MEALGKGSCTKRQDARVGFGQRIGMQKACIVANVVDALVIADSRVCECRVGVGPHT